jgi:hypothetical protein
LFEINQKEEVINWRELKMGEVFLPRENRGVVMHSKNETHVKQASK